MSIEIDYVVLKQAIAVAYQRVAEAAAKACAEATGIELVRADNSMEGTLDRITAYACSAVARTLKLEFAQLEHQLRGVKKLVK